MYQQNFTQQLFKYCSSLHSLNAFYFITASK